MSTHGYNMPDGPATAPPPSAPSAGPVPSGPGAYPVHPHQRPDPTAVGGRRTLAWLIDAVIFLVLLLTFSAIGPFGDSESEAALAGAGYTLDDGCEAIEDATGTWQCFSAPGAVPFLEDNRLYYVDNSYLLLGTMAWLAYFVLVYVVIQGVTGATAGKYAVGLRVVDDLGRPPGMGASLTRSALWVVDGTPWIIPGLVAFVVSLISVGHRRIGDMAAGTFVVSATDAGRPVQVPGYAPPGSPVPEFQLPPGGGMSGSGDMGGTGGAGGDQPGPEGAQTVPLAGPGPASAVPREAPESEMETADRVPGESSAAAPSSPRVPPSPDPTAPPTLQPPPDAVAALEERAGTPEPEGAAEAPPASRSPGGPHDPPPPAAPTQPPPPPPAYPPQWDPGRGAYIQWDPGRGRWLQWDATAESWHAI